MSERGKGGGWRGNSEEKASYPFICAPAKQNCLLRQLTTSLYSRRRIFWGAEEEISRTRPRTRRGGLSPLRVSLARSIKAGKQKANRRLPCRLAFPFLMSPIPWPSARRISKQSINCSMKQCGKKAWRRRRRSNHAITYTNRPVSRNQNPHFPRDQGITLRLKIISFVSNIQAKELGINLNHRWPNVRNLRTCIGENRVFSEVFPKLTVSETYECKRVEIKPAKNKPFPMKPI